MALSKTQQALALVKDGMSVREAARQVGVTEPTIYIAIGRNKDKQQCPCCNQIVRTGFEIDPAMVKLDADVFDAVKGGDVQPFVNESLRTFLGVGLG